MMNMSLARRVLPWALLCTLLPHAVAGQTAPLAEQQKIEALIDQVGALKDAKFIRNGSSYEVAVAVRFLRGKWQAYEAQVRTARDFIDKIASASGTTGEPYLIRFTDGKEIKSRDFLLSILRKIRV